MKKCLFIFVLTLVCALISCSEDDNNVEVYTGNNVREILTSTTWKRRSGEGSSNFKYLKFKDDGKCYYGSTASILEELTQYCIWTYNESTHMLRIYREDGYYTYNFEFEYEDNGDWVGTDGTTVWIFTPYKEN